MPGLGRYPGEGTGYPPQYSCLENPMDRGAWRATVHEVRKSRTWLGGWPHTVVHQDHPPTAANFSTGLRHLQTDWWRWQAGGGYALQRQPGSIWAQLVQCLQSVRTSETLLWPRDSHISSNASTPLWSIWEGFKEEEVRFQEVWETGSKTGWHLGAAKGNVRGLKGTFRAGSVEWFVQQALRSGIEAKNWCFQAVVLEKTLESPLIKPVNPKKNQHEYLLEGLMQKLMLQYFGHLMWRGDSLEKPLMLGNTEGRKRRGQQRTRWLGNITESMDMNMGKLQDTVEDRTPGFCKESDNLATEQQSLCFQTMCGAL